MNDTSKNVHLVGGEMLLWTDGFTGGTGGAGLRELVTRVLPRRGSVLLVGPHPEELIDWLMSGGLSVSILLRSFPDAEQIAARHGDLVVYCGRLTKLDAPRAFDAVIALDGFHRLHSAECEETSWRETLAGIAELVAEGGVLLLATANELGIHRFVEAVPAERERTDADWTPAGLDGTHPGGYGVLLGEIELTGLVAEHCYAGFPTAAAPSALIAVDALDGDHPVPDAVAVQLCARGFDDRAVLTDPAQLARKAFRHGLGGRLAPLWITVAGRGTNPARWELPAGLVADDEPEGPWTAVHEMACPGGRWVRLAPRASAPFEAGRIRRDPAALAGPVPRGRVFEEVLVAACVRDDVRMVREALRELAGWLAGHEDPAAAAFAAMDNVVWDGAEFHLIDASWRLTGPVPHQVALTRILWRFAARLLNAGYHHPWPWTVQADKLTVALLALCGHTLTEAELVAAGELEEEIRSVRGTEPLTAPDAAPPTYRDLLAVRERLQELLTAARVRIDRLETKMGYREKELRVAHRRLKAARKKAAVMRRSTSYRLGQRITRPVRLLGLLRGGAR